MNETLQEMQEPRHTPTPWDQLTGEPVNEAGSVDYHEIGEHATGQTEGSQDPAAPEIEKLDQ